MNKKEIAELKKEASKVSNNPDVNEVSEMYGNGLDQEVKPEYELVSKICVNSKWIASFLAKENQEYCECGMCKVIIKHIPNGHKYIVSKSEYEKFLEQEVKPEVCGSNQHVTIPDNGDFNFSDPHFSGNKPDVEPCPRYSLLKDGDEIKIGDEVLQEDCVTWVKLPMGNGETLGETWMLDTLYSSYFNMPIRRKNKGE